MTTLRNRSEKELAGRDAQDYLFGEDWRPLNIGLIPHLHRLLFAHMDDSTLFPLPEALF
jgi:hypothetical protein